MRGVAKVDALVALGFVLAAIGEAAVRYLATPGLLAFNATGALWLGFLAVRRQRPVVTLGGIAAGGMLGSIVTALVWPRAADGAGVWIIALMLASYSVGAYAVGRPVVLGVVLPVLVIVAADLTTRSGWNRISGILFVASFAGLLPTAVGRMVRVRNDRLLMLRNQHVCIIQEQQAQRESAVLAERLRTTERLQPSLLHGLRMVAAAAESAGDPAEVEALARSLLARTRDEVVTLSAPVEMTAPADVSVVDHVRPLRAAAQPWAVLAAGAVVAGLSVESLGVLELTAPGWLVLPASLAVGAPLALVWWRPVAAITLGWLGAATYSRLVAPLDGSLSETAFALAATFAVAALSRRRIAIVGLVVCGIGQLVGVGTHDVLGETALLIASWLGGVGLNEVSRLVEQTRANNALLEGQQMAAAARAVIEERLRLAREIHDAIGHSLTVVALQAGAARRLAGTEPGRAAEVMGTVAQVARSGLLDLERDSAEVDLGALVERVRATGLPLDADLTGTTQLTLDQRMVAFRVVQEALTNVLRHAPGASATVVVRPHDEGVEIMIANSAPDAGGPDPGTGRGLTGLRQRVAARAGRVSWGPRADGGFEVRAILPTESAAESVS